MNRRRFTGIAAGVLAAGLLVSACGGSGESDGSADGGGQSGEGGSFSYRLPGQQAVWLGDQLWLPEIEERTGVDIELVDGGPNDTYYQTIDLDMTSGGIGDAGVATLAQVQVYGPQGAFVDLAPLIAEHAPNVQAYIDSNDDFRSLITDPNGSIYGLIMERPAIGAATMYRADMLAEAGITEPPRTIAELTETLRALKDTFGSDSSYFPMSGRDVFFNLAYAFGAGFSIENGQSNGFYDTSSGGSFDLMSGNFRAMVEWYQEIYAEGLIDPIWVEGAMTEEDWQSQFLTGGASVTTDFFTRPAWFMQNGGPENDPDFDIQVLMPLEDESGEQMLAARNARWDPRRVFVVDARSENAETIVKFLDWLYTDEGQQLMHYGVEGESFETVDGEPQYLVRYDDVADNPDGTPVWAFHQDRISFAAPLENDAYYAFLDDFTASYAQDLFENYTTPHPTIRFTPEQEEERSSINAALKPAMMAGITAFTTGDRPMAEWDEFLGEMDALGYGRSIEITDEALAAMES